MLNRRVKRSACLSNSDHVGPLSIAMGPRWPGRDDLAGDGEGPHQLVLERAMKV
jgi:hypothetical protein